MLERRKDKFENEKIFNFTLDTIYIELQAWKNLTQSVEGRSHNCLPNRRNRKPLLSNERSVKIVP